MRYILGIFLGNITFIAASKVLVHPSGAGTPVFTIEWFGLIFISFIGILFIYKNAEPIKKMNKLQEDKSVQATMHV